MCGEPHSLSIEVMFKQFPKTKWIKAKKKKDVCIVCDVESAWPAEGLDFSQDQRWKKRRWARESGLEPGDEISCDDISSCSWERVGAPFSPGEGFDSALENQISLRQFNKEPKQESQASCWSKSLFKVCRRGFCLTDARILCLLLTVLEWLQRNKMCWSWFSGRLTADLVQFGPSVLPHLSKVSAVSTQLNESLQSHGF